MSPPQEQAFLQAILAEPEDDTHRLVFADWLEENGRTERAEFIRLQIERERRPVDDSERLQPGEREQALLAAHREEWLRPLPAWLGGWQYGLQFERGFPGRVNCELTDFLSWDESVWQVAPLTTLRLGSMEGDGGSRSAEAKEPDMRALAAKPELAHLRTLDLTEGWFWVADLRVLFTSPHLTRLRSLYLGDNGLGDEIVRVLAATTTLPSLTDLDLGANQLSDEGAAVLAASPLLGQLTALCLGNSNIGDAGAERLASSPHVSNLAYLALYCNLIDDRGALALAASPHLARLKGLSLMVNNIGPAGQAALRERFGNRVQF
jgi:uncharacterized protein (TIGR02996 family)